MDRWQSLFTQDKYRGRRAVSLRSSGREIEARIAEWEKEYNFDKPHMALKRLTSGEKLHKM